MSERQIKSHSDGTIVDDKPEAKLVSKNIGLIKIPSLTTSNTRIQKEFAQSIQDMIKNLELQHDIKGWIVDLRNNYGGGMYPMIAGVGPLTGSGKLGYFVKHVNDKLQYSAWNYKKGSSGLGKTVFIKVDRPYKLKNKNIKIAVLINKATSSAGEMTAISFSEAKNVKFFGQPSGGFTTGNESFNLLDGTKLFLAMVFSADRNKKIFKNQIIPDEFVAPGTDNAEIEAAEKWLMTK